MGGPPQKSFLSEIQNIHRRKNLEAGAGGPPSGAGGPLGGPHGPSVATSPPSANATSTLADQLRSRLEERRKSKEEEQQPQQHSVRKIIKSVHLVSLTSGALPGKTQPAGPNRRGLYHMILGFNYPATSLIWPLWSAPIFSQITINFLKTPLGLARLGSARSVRTGFANYHKLS